MILKRFYDSKLAQASYLIGCAKTGEAAVIDANRNCAQYLIAAAEEGLQITTVTETHIHADYVSGSRELAERAGAQLYLSDEGDENWKYGFANQGNVTLVKDGDSIRVGNIRLDVLKTPGHTPEHISFILTDEPASSEPLGAFTGDFIFVGDVGRPDLLERAAGFEGTMEAGARRLFESLQKFKSKFSDGLMLFPAHGSGSACGKSLGGVPVSSLGYEKLSNWGLRMNDEDAFVKAVLEGQPEPPFYFKEMKRINRDGPASVGDRTTPPYLAGTKIFDLVERKAHIIDIRSAGEAAAGYIPETLNIPLSRDFTNWAGWLIPYDEPIYLIANSAEQAAEAVADLRTIGLDNVVGQFGRDALRAWDDREGKLETTTQSDSRTVFERHKKSEVTVLDVRGKTEFVEGHISGALSMPLGYLKRNIDKVPTDKPIVVYCLSGSRSPIAATLLRKLGISSAINMPGGFCEYESAHLPVETGEGNQQVLATV